MKRLGMIGLGLAMAMGLTLVGCESSEEVKIEDTKEETVVEEQIEKEEPEEEVVEEPKFDMDEFNKHLTTSMSEDELETYFNSIDGQVVEFDCAILESNLRDGYDTRLEVLLIGGDYSDDNANVYLKDKDIAILDMNGLGTAVNKNVRVKAEIEGYNRDYGWLEIDIEEINER